MKLVFILFKSISAKFEKKIASKSRHQQTYKALLQGHVKTCSIAWGLAPKVIVLNTKQEEEEKRESMTKLFRPDT